MNLPGAPDILVRALSICAMSTAILALMLLASRSLSRNAALRHLGWATTFVLVLVLPLLQSHLRPAFQYQLPLLGQGAVDREAAPAQPQSPAVQPAAGPVSSATSASRDMVLILGTVWLCGVGVIAFRCAAAAVQLRWMRKQSVPFAVEDSHLPAVRARRWHVRMSTTTEPVAPFTWGFFRPVVLLPKGSDRWERERMRAVLLHELAHVERGDNLFQILALAACALHWFNPLVWVCARRMRAEAEIASDDLVLCAGVRPSSYATELLQFALQLKGRSKPFALLGASIAAPFTLETRITSIINPHPVRGRLRPRQALAMQALCLCTLCCLCFLRPTFAAEQLSTAMDPLARGDDGSELSRRDVSRPDESRGSERRRPTSARRGEVRPMVKERPSPDVLSEEELRELRRRRNAHSGGASPDVWRPAPASARATGTADSPGHSDRLGADRLPP
jgi:beta-lactamase regulating signal transducer with metallopeptidase domain